MGGRTAVGFAVALWLGLLAAASPTFVIIAIVATVPCLWLAWRLPGHLGSAALIGAVACAGAVRGAGHVAVLERAGRGIPDEGDLFRIVGRVVEPPLRDTDEPVAIVRIERSEPPLNGGVRVRLRLPSGSPAEWGDRVEALARLDAPRSAGNPGAFDPLAGARANALIGAGRAFDARRIAARGLWRLPQATAARWRRAVESRLAVLSPGARELVVPLVTGDRSELGPELSAALRASGLVHLLALSGLHVVWLAALARAVCGAAGGGLGTRAAAGALCAIAYAGIAGPLPSLLRAVAAEVASAAARGLGRALDPMQSLALAAIALLTVAPGWALDVGFQLSCAATLGLVRVAPGLARALPGPPSLHALWSTTAGAQVAALPVLIQRFHAISWTGLLANLAAVPVSSLLLAAAWLGALGEIAVPGAGHLFLSACEPLVLMLRLLTTMAARAPRALVALGSEPAVPMLATAGAVLLAAGLSRERTVEDAQHSRPIGFRMLAAAGAFSVVLALVLGFSARPLGPPPRAWWLVMLDVGQGTAIALGFEDGWWLVDAGPRTPHLDAGENSILPFLRWAGVRRLDVLALTHDDGDHTGGAAAVRRGVAVTRVLAPIALPRVPGPGQRFGAAGLAAGDILHETPRVAVLWPPPLGDPRGADIATDNDAGLVLEIGVGAGRALLLADVDSLVESQLPAHGPVALLQVAHHGSGSSSGAAALAGFRPGRALISCGRRNAFGHPAPAALARLAASGAILERTDHSGALWFECTPAGVRRLDWRHHPLRPRVPSTPIPATPEPVRAPARD